MTQMHFEAIARDIKFQMENTEDEAGRAALRSLAASLSVTFSILNPRFKRSIFLTACGF